MRYQPALDGLRALAVSVVVVFHADPYAFPTGWMGVDLFFVLSGFLITGLLVEEHAATGRIALLRFYGRRLARLMPALGLLLVVYLACAWAVFPRRSFADHAGDAALAALYLSDYSVPLLGRPGYLGHTWSLAIEEHFYLVWPAMLLAILALPSRMRWQAVFGLFIAATVWRVDNAVWQAWDLVYFRFDTRLSGLMLGATLALAPIGALRRSPLVASASFAVGTVGLVTCLTTFAFWDDASLTVGITAIEVSTALLIVGAGAGIGRAVLSAPMLARIGILSYGIYLWHYPIMRAIRGDLSFPMAVFVGGTAALVMAWISYRTVEAFGRTLRARLRPTQSSVVDLMSMPSARSLR